MAATSATSPEPGPAVDLHGNPVIDPTRNVLDLVSAAIDRQDDLRRAERDLTKANMQRLDELARLRDQFSEKLSQAEARRIDAIRSVDVTAVAAAAADAATRANTLATQVATSAETLRTQVSAAATAATVALAAALEPIQKDIADLRRAQYEAQGKQGQVVEGRSGAAFGLQVLAGLFGLISVALAIALAFKK